MPLTIREVFQIFFFIHFNRKVFNCGSLCYTKHRFGIYLYLKATAIITSTERDFIIPNHISLIGSKHNIIGLLKEKITISIHTLI